MKFLSVKQKKSILLAKMTIFNTFGKRGTVCIKSIVCIVGSKSPYSTKILNLKIDFKM